MKVVVVWKRGTEYGREMEEWIHGFSLVFGREVESIDPDTKDGDEFARIYEIVEYPTILALDESGKVLEMWRGLPLPTLNEVSYYADFQKSKTVL